MSKTTQNAALYFDPEQASWYRLGALGRRFSMPGTLTTQERELLAGCVARAVDHRAGFEVSAMDVPADTPRIVLAGWIGLSRCLLDGRRQIVDLFLPGDLVAYSSIPGARTKGVYHCLTDARYADAGEIVKHASAGAASDGFAAVVRGMEDEGHARLHERLTSIGRMMSHERLAHFIADLYRRHALVGLVVGTGFDMPLTQEAIGDALGMSTVHVNRTLQLFRREQILKTGNGRWQILDFERLQAYATGSRDNQKSVVSW